MSDEVHSVGSSGARSAGNATPAFSRSGAAGAPETSAVHAYNATARANAAQAQGLAARRDGSGFAEGGTSGKPTALGSSLTSTSAARTDARATSQTSSPTTTPGSAGPQAPARSRQQMRGESSEALKQIDQQYINPTRTSQLVANGLHGALHDADHSLSVKETLGQLQLQKNGKTVYSEPKPMNGEYDKGAQAIERFSDQARKQSAKVRGMSDEALHSGVMKSMAQSLDPHSDYHLPGHDPKCDVGLCN